MKKDAILERFTRNNQAEQPEDCSHSRTAERLLSTDKETSKVISGVCPSYHIPPSNLSTPQYKTLPYLFYWTTLVLQETETCILDCNL